jgi:O-antigen ligase
VRISDLVLIIRGVCAFLTLVGFSYFTQYIFPSSLTSALLITTPLVPILTYIIIGRFNFAWFIIFSIWFLLVSVCLVFGNDYGSLKLLILFISPLVAIVILGRGVDMDYIKIIIASGLFFLIVGIIYKLEYGFWQRSIRFGFLGPITFAWIMSFSLLASIIAWTKFRTFTYIFLINIFVLSILWTNSKGPIFGLFITFVVYSLMNFKFKYFLFSIVILIVLLFIFIHFGQNTRIVKFILLLATNFDNYILNFGDRSFDLRINYLIQSWSIFTDHTFLGIGMGRWSEYVLSDHNYPHNVYIELMVEIGFSAIILMMILFIYIFRFINSPVLFYCSVFACSVVSFSGDFSYLKYVLFFIFLDLSAARRLDCNER